MRFSPRRARKKDAVEKVIREALEKAGWQIYDELPCDLLAIKVLHWEHCATFRGHDCNCNRLPEVRLFECKTPRGKKNPKAAAFMKTISRKGIGSNISPELREKIANPINFKPLTQDLAHGYEADILAEVAKAIVDAKAAKP